MNQLMTWLSQLFGSWKPWVIVEPWDIGVRVRLGKVAATLQPGPHFRIPFLDDVVLVNTRLRTLSTPSVTLQVNGGTRIRTIKPVIGFYIDDPTKALLMFARVEDSIMALAMAATSNLVSADAVKADLERRLAGSGVRVDFVNFTEDAHVHTIRLLQSGGDVYQYGAPPVVGQVTRY